MELESDALAGFKTPSLINMPSKTLGSKIKTSNILRYLNTGLSSMIWRVYTLMGYNTYSLKPSRTMESSF